MTDAEQPKLIFTVPEAAKHLGVSRDKVLYWINTGKVVAANVGEGKLRPRWRIQLGDLQAFLAQRTNQRPVETSRKTQRPKVPQHF